MIQKTTAARGVDTSAGSVAGITVTVRDYSLVFSNALVTLTGIIEITGVMLKQRTWRHTDIQTDWYAGIITE